MLAVVTRRARVPLLWSVLDNRGGSSDSGERIALMQRYLAIFGAASIRLLLADREFIGIEWMDFLNKNNIPFAIRMKEKLIVATEDGRRLALGSLLRKCRGVRTFQAALGDRSCHRELQLNFAARRLEGGELLIVASNTPARPALAAYRKRWAIECLFGDTKSRGLNLEDTRLVTPRKLALLLGLVALAITWAARAAATLIGRKTPPRKSHGYLAKSWFRIGFDQVSKAPASRPARRRRRHGSSSPHPPSDDPESCSVRWTPFRLPSPPAAAHHPVMTRPLSPATRAAQALRHIDPVTGSITPPIDLSSTFARDEAYAPRQPYIYAREGGPTVAHAEAVLADLDGAAASLAFASGMSAFTALTETLAAGDHAVAPAIMYHGGLAWLRRLADRRGIALTEFDPAAPGNPRASHPPRHPPRLDRGPHQPHLGRPRHRRRREGRPRRRCRPRRRLHRRAALHAPRARARRRRRLPFRHQVPRRPLRPHRRRPLLRPPR